MFEIERERMLQRVARARDLDDHKQRKALSVRDLADPALAVNDRPLRQCTAADYNDGGPCKNCGYVPKGRNLPEKT